MKLKVKAVTILMLIYMISQVTTGTAFLKDDYDETYIIVEDSYQEIVLGSSTSRFHLEITVTSNVTIDVLILDWDEFNDYPSIDTFLAGELNTTSAYIELDTNTPISYYVILDNTNDNHIPYGANYTSPADVHFIMDSTRLSIPTIISGYSILIFAVILCVIVLGYIKKNQNIKLK
ncbi:MAG: hypothetical protein ACFFAS_20625 [Promethearchaeota archaeon]